MLVSFYFIFLGDESMAGLDLSRLWQLGHPTTYNAPSCI